MDLRPELHEDFLLLADADLAAQEPGVRQIIASRLHSRYGVRILHKHVPRNHRIPLASLEEMRDAGLLAISRLDQGRVRLRVTADGHVFARALRNRANLSPGD